jgi:hypothetical protein
MPIHNILSNAPQLSISQKALGTLPEEGNVMPKHVGSTTQKENNFRVGAVALRRPEIWNAAPLMCLMIIDY